MFSNRAKRLGAITMFSLRADSHLVWLILVTRPLLTFLMTVARRHEDAKLSVDAVYIKSCTHFLSLLHTQIGFTANDRLVMATLEILS